MAEANIPHTFTNGVGNTIDATQVNANFTELESSVNDVDKDQLESALADKLGVSSTATVRRGKCIVATEETTTSTSYATLTTPDRVSSVVLPTDGLIFVTYLALMKSSASTGYAAIYVGSNQASIGRNDGAPVAVEAGVGSSSYYGLVHTTGAGLSSAASSAANSSNVTTGQVVGGPITLFPSAGGTCAIFAAAGTYDISVKFKTASGTLSAKERKLWVWTQAF